MAATPPSELPGTLWQTADGKFVVRVQACDESGICARLIWLREPIDRRTGELKLDYKNPDDSLTGRPICGLQIVQDLRPKGENRWDGGWVYNPDDGGTYSAAMTLDPEEDRIALRAYVAIKALGKTTYLYRLHQPVEACEPVGDVENS